MKSSVRVAAVVAAFLLCLSSFSRAEEGRLCPLGMTPGMALPHLRRALLGKEEVTIVAIGSSSTAGFHASDVAHTYPAILQAELRSALPTSHIVVLNRGVGGQDAIEMLARLDTDVLASAPALVIWQVGANGALRGMNPDLFRELVDSGVRRLEAAGIDVVLMDNQRAPAILASAQNAGIDQALAEVAGHEGAALFARGHLMDLWQKAGYPYSDFISDDGVHHNDRGYACLAKALAAAILEGIGHPPVMRNLQAASAR